MEGSPAAKAGLRIGDVILEANGKEINEPDELIRIVNETPIGKGIRLKIHRGKSTLEVLVIIAERPQE
jgi:putative serine protease PepD